MALNPVYVDHLVYVAHLVLHFLIGAGAVILWFFFRRFNSQLRRSLELHLQQARDHSALAGELVQLKDLKDLVVEYIAKLHQLEQLGAELEEVGALRDELRRHATSNLLHGSKDGPLV